MVYEKICNNVQNNNKLQFTDFVNMLIRGNKIKMSYLGGIDFMLLSGSSNTLGQASGVTEM